MFTMIAAGLRAALDYMNGNLSDSDNFFWPDKEQVAAVLAALEASGATVDPDEFEFVFAFVNGDDYDPSDVLDGDQTVTSS